MTSKYLIIPHSKNEWSEPCGNRSFRTWPRNGIPTLWRRLIDSSFFGGEIVHCVPTDSAVANSWLQDITRGTAKTVIGFDIS
jgi:hypothetical protein